MRFRRVLIVVSFLVVLFGVSQVGASSVEYIDYTEDFVNNSNDDNAPTHKGTHSVFVDLQDYGANYDQMQEEDTGGAGGTTEYKADAWIDSAIEWTDDANAYDGDWGTAAYDLGVAGGDDYPSNYAYDFDSANSGIGTITQVDIVVRLSVTGLSGSSDWWQLTLDVGASTDNALSGSPMYDQALTNLTYTDVTEPNGGGWSWSEIWSAQVHFDTEKVGGSDNADVYIYEYAIKVTVSGASNYELDLEIGWESADYDESNEWLCIYPVTGGGWPDEDLKVDVWTGSWTNVFSDLTPDQWNNVSISSYLTDVTFEMRFLGGTEIGDTTQDTFEIDAVLITTYSVAYTEDVFETIPLSDSTTVSMGASVTIFEEVNFSESVAVGANFVLNILEVLGLSVSVVVTKAAGGNEYFVTIFEVIGASESVTTSMSASVSVFETIGFTDIIAAYRGLSITVFENILMSSSTATSQLTHYYVYEVFGIISSVGVVGGVIPTPPTGSMFYQLFFSLNMWGYLGPIALVVFGYLLTKKEKNLGIFFIIVESLLIAQYLALIEATPDYWWHVIILLLGNLLTIGLLISDR